MELDNVQKGKGLRSESGNDGTETGNTYKGLGPCAGAVTVAGVGASV